jgi:AcrR family transcriptional regulator
MTELADSGTAARHPRAGAKTRRRGAALEAVLLDAAWEELQAAGYAAMTMEAVANRAGTSRPVLYRRWPTQADLVIAALRRHAPTFPSEVPDTGSLRGDVLAVLEGESEQLARAGIETIYGLLGDYLADAELFARIHDRIVHGGTGIIAVILKRAADRGEARGDVSPRVASLPTDLFRHQLFLHRVPPPHDVIVEIVDDVFLPLVRP